MLKRYQLEDVGYRFKPSGGAYTEVAELIRLRHGAVKLKSMHPKRSRHSLSGLIASKFRGRGIDFAEVRAYEPGDDVRTIDWRVTARKQIPHTKLFQEEREQPVLILTDQSHNMFFGSKNAFKSVTAAQIAALIAWTSLNQGDRIGGITFADKVHKQVRPNRGKRSVLRLLNNIGEFNHQLNKQPIEVVTNYLTEALINARRVAKHGSIIVIISDFKTLNADAVLHLKQVAIHNHIKAVYVSDPLEAELPPPDIYTISNGQQRIQINTSSKVNRERYARQFKSRQAWIIEQFNKLKSPLVHISTQQNPITALAQAYADFGKVFSR